MNKLTKTEIRAEIMNYSQLSADDKLKWLNDCLLFNHFAFTEEEKKNRENISNFLNSHS